MTEFVEVPLLPQSDASNGGRFSYAVAEAVQSAFVSAASRVEGQAGSRASYVSTAKADFRGHFSELFAANAATAAGDAEALASAMRTVAGYVGQMIEAAHEEDNRRRRNNEWVREHNDRNGFEQVRDWFFGEAERPNADPGPAPTFASPSPSLGSRENPAPGGGYGGGTSSARPADLRSFAAGSRGLDDSLAAEPGSLDGQMSSFASSCYWGSIDASGVISAYRRYLQANENDAVWAVTVADAFAAAGGEGAVASVSDAAVNAALAAAGVSATRSSLAIDPPTAAGAMPTSGYANDPVNTATGNFIEPESDLAFAGASSNLVLSRMYNSLGSGLESEGAFGPGWASVLDQSLMLSDEGCRWVMADGRAVDFPREGAGWSRAVGENYWLASEPATHAVFQELSSLPAGTAELLVVRDNQGAWWAFSPSGVWLGTGSAPGRTVSALREETPDGVTAGLVGKLEHVRGRFLEVDYAAGRAAVVRASDGRRIEYEYDAAGRLVSVTTELGARTYRWNEAGLIDAVYSAAGVLEAENTYDASGRVVLQVTQHGRRVRFAYLPGRVTVVSDEDGTRSNSWIADAKGRLVGVLDSYDQRQSMAYDAHGNLVSFTERDGAVTVHAYDNRGRKIRTVTPEGADLTYGWDDQDRVTMLVTASGAVVSYEYAGELSRDPAVVLDPLGGRTELEWQDGQLLQVTDPAGVRVGFEYDAFGDLVATRNAAGDVARIVRDQTGRPVTAVSPSGAETRFTYDGAGLLVRREDPDGAVWAFEHDAAGRVTASVAPDGGRTELEYAANGELVRTIDPLGRSIERVFDELGNVTGALLPDGAAWGFTHDALSRLVGVTDPAGHDSTREYDTVGALSAVMDPTGVRRDAASDRRAGTATLTEAFGSATIRFDEFGRPTRVEAADGSAELVTYDAAGNPVELVDGEGGLTVLGRDVAGKIITITSPSGAVTRYEYDSCGRPWRTTDPLGAVTELTYDADQRVASRTLPTGEVETFEYDAGGRLTAWRTPGQGLSRYGYDSCGRLAFSQDTWYGTRRFRYNVAGELVESVNGVGGRTRFEYDIRGRLVRITDPLGGVTTRTYTVTDLVDSVTDPLGRVATATYDPAGRQLSQTDPDGHTTTWTYDAAGREDSTTVDGKLISTISRDVLRRRAVITDYTRPDGLAVEHELGFDRCGRLTSRTRGAQGLSWEYDADGHRTSITDAYGITTTYTRDAAGQITAVGNPLLGKASFSYNAAGRITSATAGDLVQVWAYRNGALAEHRRCDRAGSGAADVTLLGRDGDGRITGLTRSGAFTRYEYDGAGQMVSAITTRTGEPDRSGVVLGWEFDAGGRLVRETFTGGYRVYGYDAAGQLLSMTEQNGSRTEYVHDGLGRRTRRIGPDGSWTEYAWGPTGLLCGSVMRDRDGVELSRHSLWVDASGELAAVDGCDLWWDTAKPVPALAGIGVRQVLPLPGGVTGVGEAWTAPGWRAVRPTDQVDPWAVVGATAVSHPAPGSAAGAAAGALAGPAGVLPSAVTLTGNGGVDIAGLEWLGARAYDPASRGFLSTDPLAPVLGAGWDGNPYAYAGNNPLNTTDPTGLRPLTDDELKAYDKSVGSHWEYVVGGLSLVAGAALMFVPGGQVAGMGLISFGADVVIQKATKGTVNWAQSAAMGAVGLLGGAALTAGRAAAATASSASRLGSYVAVNAGVNGAAGAVGGGVTYLVKHGGRVDSWRGFAGSVAGGTVSGAVGGLAGPAGGTLARAGGYGAYTLTAAGARPTIQAVAATTALGSGGAIAGTVTDKFVSNEAVTASDVGWAGLTGGALTYLPGGPSVSSTLQQAARTNVSTMSGLASLGPNSLRLMRSSLYGTTTGSGLDLAKFFVFGN